MAAQDNFEQQLAAAGGQGFEAHVVDDEHVGFEVTGEQAGFWRASYAGGKIAHEVEDGAVIDGVAVADGFAPERLGKVALAELLLVLMKLYLLSLTVSLNSFSLLISVAL